MAHTDHMEVHERARERIADLLAQEVNVLRAAYIPLLVRPAYAPRLTPAATRQGHP